MLISIETAFNVGERFYFVSSNQVHYYEITQIQYSGNLDINEEEHQYLKYALHMDSETYTSWTPTEKELLEDIEKKRFFESKKEAVKYVIDQL